MSSTDNQHLALGIAAGTFAAAVGAALWALITVATNYQIGWMAVGIGFLVGYAIRYAGKARDSVFGLYGAVIALLGCVAGNFLTVAIVVARQEQVTVLTVLSGLSAGTAIDLMKESFQPMDLLFYGIAIYEAYRFSFTPLPEGESVVANCAE